MIIGVKLSSFLPSTLLRDLSSYNHLCFPKNTIHSHPAFPESFVSFNEQNVSKGLLISLGYKAYVVGPFDTFCSKEYRKTLRECGVRDV